MSQFLQKIADARVLVVGDAMLDRYWFGDVDRISPEAPVPVLAITDNEERAGGAANVACNISALGGRCDLISVVGNDDAAKSLERLLSERGVTTRFTRDESHVTTVKLRLLSRNQQLLRADFEQAPDDVSIIAAMDRFNKSLDTADIVLLSDYGKGVLRDIDQIIDAAKAKGIKVLVDPKGRDFARYRGASLITPNRHEFENVVGPCPSLENMAVKAAELLKTIEVSNLLVTLSDKGMALFDHSGLVFHQKARAREVFDVSGAGDTVIGAMAAMLAAGADYREAIHIANAAAAIVVGKLGAATVSVNEILAEIGKEEVE
ncbi:MAG: D-glycero-beta-D-manno-heptose-7-phosphate kinase [Gammaproteobacteria bacterium]|nr:MAG: D-glycero-beta-D-manno-heptose-7-phosphate kinase [Gammaproteobacteria bacterium]